MRSLGERCRSFSLVRLVLVRSEDYTVPRLSRGRCEQLEQHERTQGNDESSPEENRPGENRLTVKTPASKPIPTEAANRLRFFTERKDAITETIRQLVEIESPSDNKPAVDQLGALLAGRFEKIGGHAKFHRVAGLRRPPASGLRRRAQRQAGAAAGPHRHGLSHGNALDHAVPRGRRTALGPGRARHEVGHCADAACARRTAHMAQRQLPRPVTVLLVSDEEVGSDSSRRITESLARNPRRCWCWSRPTESRAR